MLLPKDIIQDGHPTLRLISENVTVPLSRKDKDKGKEMLKYLEMSLDEKTSEKYQMTPGVGLAAPQIGISKRMFACFFFDGKEDYQFVIYNPVIKEKSKEMIYLKTGEGCLSVPGKSGHVLRHKKLVVEGYIYNNLDKSLDYKEITLTDYAAIVFQHEYDHLDGILFTDKITEDYEKYEAIA